MILIGGFVAATIGVLISAVWPIERPFDVPRLLLGYALTVASVAPLSLGVHWKASGWHGMKSLGFAAFQAALIGIPVFFGRVLGSLGTWAPAA